MTNTRIDRNLYKRVHKTDDNDKVAAADNEIRVIAAKGQRTHTIHAVELLKENKFDNVVINGMGAAVYNAVNVAEIVKRHVAGLHQTTTIRSITMTDSYEAIEEGKDGIEVERKVSAISINLSLKPLDVAHVGYQSPLAEEEMATGDIADAEIAQSRPTRPRGPRRSKKPSADADKEGAEKKEGGEKKTSSRRRARGHGKKTEDGEKAAAAPSKSADGEKPATRGGRRHGRGRGAAADGAEAPKREARAPRGGYSGGRGAGGESTGRGRGSRGGGSRGGRGGADREERAPRGGH